MATEYTSKINGKKILAERASYTEGGINLDTKLNGLGTASTKDIPSSGDASSSQVVMGNDTRLSNSRTPTSHTHGNIQNGGTLQTSDVAIANGDKLVITDSSDSNKVARSSVSFDGSTTTKALTPKGTFESFYQKPSGGIPDTDIASASTWSGKQDALSTQTAYTSKGTATKVPQISTNSLGQVTGITEVTISGVTPASHASSATTYGTGTTSNYGHVKLTTGDMNGASYADGVAASKDHTHSQYESASNKKQSISDTSTTDFPSSKAVAEFVNSSIATNTANFLGTKDVVSDLGLTTSATNTQIATALKNYTWPTGVTPTNNDYVFVSINLSTTTDVDEYRRFKYTSETTSWGYEFTLNNSSFTQAQWNAINSGLTSTDKTTYDNHVANTTVHVTSSDKSAWNGKQDALTAQTAYTSQGSATKVPQITTNSLGQVTGITEVTISGVTPASHAHGNIQNGGTLQTTDVTIGSGDKLVVTDSSDSDKIARTSASFDGSTTTTALTPKGTFNPFVTDVAYNSSTKKLTKTYDGSTSDIITLGTAAALDAASSGDATDVEVVKGSDSRLVTMLNLSDYFSYNSTTSSWVCNAVPPLYDLIVTQHKNVIINRSERRYLLTSKDSSGGFNIYAFNYATLDSDLPVVYGMIIKIHATTPSTETTTLELNNKYAAVDNHTHGNISMNGDDGQNPHDATKFLNGAGNWEIPTLTKSYTEYITTQNCNNFLISHSISVIHALKATNAPVNTSPNDWFSYLTIAHRSNDSFACQLAMSYSTSGNNGNAIYYRGKRDGSWSSTWRQLGSVVLYISELTLSSGTYNLYSAINSYRMGDRVDIVNDTTSNVSVQLSSTSTDKVSFGAHAFRGFIKESAVRWASSY